MKRNKTMPLIKEKKNKEVSPLGFEAVENFRSVRKEVHLGVRNDSLNRIG